MDETKIGGHIAINAAEIEDRNRESRHLNADSELAGTDCRLW
jgi:hypothetical protein